VILEYQQIILNIADLEKSVSSQVERLDNAQTILSQSLNELDSKLQQQTVLQNSNSSRLQEQLDLIKNQLAEQDSKLQQQTVFQNSNSKKVVYLQHQVDSQNSNISKLQNQLDYIDYQLNKLNDRTDRHESRLKKVVEKLRANPLTNLIINILYR
jgi:chromosome segregation ATPase